jgi:hypothetical protein
MQSNRTWHEDESGENTQLMLDAKVQISWPISAQSHFQFDMEAVIHDKPCLHNLMPVSNLRILINTGLEIMLLPHSQ